MREKIKPCPFCGSDGNLVKFDVKGLFMTIKGYYVGCTNHMCYAGCYFINNSEKFKTSGEGWLKAKDAIAEWNKRHSVFGNKYKKKGGDIKNV